jgi:hypothetical protein
MVTPYLSRLRSAESGPRLRPRPRSRFEPAPTLPVDGPAVASLGLSMPPEMEAEAADEPADRTWAAPDPSPPALPAPAPPKTVWGEPGRPSDPAAAAETATRDGGRLPVPALRTARPPLASPPAASGPAPRGESRRPAAAGNGEEAVPQAVYGQASAPGPAPAPWSMTRRTLPDRPSFSADPIRAGREQEAEPSPPQPSLPARPPASRRLDQAGRAAHTPESGPDDPRPAVRRPEPPADVPAARVTAAAAWLRDADSVAARDEAARPTTASRPGPAPPYARRDRPGPAAPAQITVTIERIEVRAPAADPAPARPQSSGPGRRTPSLDDYLATRTRARGRRG